MQCPPTSPGSKLRKFHFVAAAVNASLVDTFPFLDINPTHSSKLY